VQLKRSGRQLRRRDGSPLPLLVPAHLVPPHSNGSSTAAPLRLCEAARIWRRLFRLFVAVFPRAARKLQPKLDSDLLVGEVMPRKQALLS